MNIRTQSTTNGFTIIEITIAIAIMGILMVTLGSGFTYVLKRTRIFATNTTLRSVKNSIQQFNNDTSTYPQKLEDLVRRPADPKIAKRWVSSYMEKEEMPEDAWKHPLVYKLNAKGAQNPYELYSWGPNDEGSPQEEWLSVWNLE
jgi:type II secretion system protein G